MGEKLYIQRLLPTAKAPARQTPGSAGYDIFSAVDTVVPPCCQCLIPTGLAMAIPEGYYGRMASRSSIVVAYKCCVDAGVIDSDYRGHIHVLMYNRSSEPFSIAIGDRIAQLIIEKIGLPEVVESTNGLPTTARGAGGFGSTGK